MNNIHVGKKVLVTTDNWFVAPDGLQYRAVFGTVQGIFTDSEALGIKTNSRSTNWYAQVGNMMIAGCQIHYAIVTDETAAGERVRDYSVEGGECKEFRRPVQIYDADKGLFD